MICKFPQEQPANTKSCSYSQLSGLETHEYFSYSRLSSYATRVCLLKMSKNTSFEIRVVWVVMQLTPSVVTTLASPLTLLQHINRGREVQKKGLGISALLCWRNLNSLCPHLCPGGLPLVLQSLEAEFFGEEKQQNQIKVS